MPAARSSPARAGTRRRRRPPRRSRGPRRRRRPGTGCARGTSCASVAVDEVDVVRSWASICRLERRRSRSRAAPAARASRRRGRGGARRRRRRAAGARGRGRPASQPQQRERRRRAVVRGASSTWGATLVSVAVTAPSARWCDRDVARARAGRPRRPGPSRSASATAVATVACPQNAHLGLRAEVADVVVAVRPRGVRNASLGVAELGGHRAASRRRCRSPASSTTPAGLPPSGVSVKAVRSAGGAHRVILIQERDGRDRRGECTAGAGAGRRGWATRR